MKTKVYMVLLLILSVVLITACTTNTSQTGTNTQTPVQNNAQQNTPATITQPAATPSSGQTITMDKIYNYGKLTNFEYNISSTASGITTSTDMKYALSSDTINGKAAWLSTAEITTSGANILSKTWTDKTTFACLKISSVISFNGQDMETPGECPQTASEEQSKGKTPTLTYQGTESVIVPAGTYNAKKYMSDNNATYYYSDSVPIPVKVMYAGAGSSVMELVGWS